MLKEYIKPELNENPKIKIVLEQHADKILSIIKQEVITYDDFRKLVRSVFKDSESKEGLFSYERELQQLYDEYRLFKRFVSNKERAQKVIEALLELSNNKFSIADEDLK
jgi:hypothetical protein